MWVWNATLRDLAVGAFHFAIEISLLVITTSRLTSTYGADGMAWTVVKIHGVRWVQQEGSSTDVINRTFVRSAKISGDNCFVQPRLLAKIFLKHIRGVLRIPIFDMGKNIRS